MGSVCGCCGGRDRLEVNGTVYQKVGVLGQGGFANVFEVENSEGRRLAIKCMKCLGADRIQAARREASLMRKFAGPSVMPVLDYQLKMTSQDEGELLIVMPIFPDGDLETMLHKLGQRRQFLSESEVLCMFEQICRAVEPLHNHTKNGIPTPLAHLDIKPLNVLLKKSPTGFQCYLTDYGSVRTARRVIQSRADQANIADDADRHTSPAYRPPELFDPPRDVTVDERADVWSLGCLLYSLCFFESPFEVEYSKGGSITILVCSGRYTIPEPHPFSERLIQLIRSMMTVNFQQRPTLAEVLREVTLLRQENETGGRRTPSADSGGRTVSRSSESKLVAPQPQQQEMGSEFEFDEDVAMEQGMSQPLMGVEKSASQDSSSPSTTAAGSKAQAVSRKRDTRRGRGNSSALDAPFDAEEVVPRTSLSPSPPTTVAAAAATAASTAASYEEAGSSGKNVRLLNAKDK